MAPLSKTEVGSPSIGAKRQLRAAGKQSKAEKLLHGDKRTRSLRVNKSWDLVIWADLQEFWSELLSLGDIDLVRVVLDAQLLKGDSDFQAAMKKQNK